MKTTIQIDLQTNFIRFNEPQYLQRIIRGGSIRSITFGDLHGNTHKLLCFLSAAGVINSLDLRVLARIYNQIATCDISAKKYEDVSRRFIAQLQRTTFRRVDFKLRFIGDTLADRGLFDLLTLLVFEAMDKSGLNFTIIYSNHDQLFLETFEFVLQKKWRRPGMALEYISSLYTLCIYLFGSMVHVKIGGKEYITCPEGEEESVSDEKLRLMRRLITCYQQHLSLLECEVVEGVRHVFSHAPTSELCVRKVYEELMGGHKMLELSDHYIIALNNKLKTIIDEQKLSEHIRTPSNAGPLHMLPTWDSRRSCLANFSSIREDIKDVDLAWVNIFGHVGERYASSNKTYVNLDDVGNLLGKEAQVFTENKILTFIQQHDEQTEPKIKRIKRLLSSDAVPIYVTSL
jgi:hypothetical protein